MKGYGVDRIVRGEIYETRTRLAPDAWETDGSRNTIELEGIKTQRVVETGNADSEECGEVTGGRPLCSSPSLTTRVSLLVSCVLRARPECPTSTHNFAVYYWRKISGSTRTSTVQANIIKRHYYYNSSDFMSDIKTIYICFETFYVVVENDPYYSNNTK